jgi:hypothetical protein
VTVRAGDVQRELGWWNRIPSVCSALDGREFQRMSGARLVQRRGPVQSTTSEWVFDLSDDPNGVDPQAGSHAADLIGARRLVAEWDGVSFRPCVEPDGIEAGQRVVLDISPVRDARDLAGNFGSLVGTLSAEEAAAMQANLDRTFETISDEW